MKLLQRSPEKKTRWRRWYCFDMMCIRYEFSEVVKSVCKLKSYSN
ncbi:hypothetical protein HanPSC8_Chr17g0760801 [Helianthus annuus]|nr:hypothetical protein HanPSC8_Chr17g0760801 [Helianthus annuus]